MPTNLLCLGEPGEQSPTAGKKAPLPLRQSSAPPSRQTIAFFFSGSEHEIGSVANTIHRTFLASPWTIFTSLWTRREKPPDSGRKGTGPFSEKYRTFASKVQDLWTKGTGPFHQRYRTFTQKVQDLLRKGTGPFCPESRGF